MHLNIEIKARSNNTSFIRNYLLKQQADHPGIDHQTDTYFDVPHGRMKLREGNIENALIHYHRENKSGPKASHVILYPTDPSKKLKEMLISALNVKAIVKKKREIYFIDNVKFHIDEVDGLGSFIEIEAIDQRGTIGQQKLEQQCKFYMSEFRIEEKDLVTVSYSDLLWKSSH
ncbi:class IV adenylate cyclase [Pollutibacter soli]|uniref:class IV adenylate cyclase n=1 Tax=Pollutibacter soli TaxID=3034157 RepID=UPI0030137219